MNKATIVEMIGLQRAVTTIKDRIEKISAEEQEKYDNMSEKVQESEDGEIKAQLIEDLDHVVNYLIDATTMLKDILEEED